MIKQSLSFIFLLFVFLAGCSEKQQAQSSSKKTNIVIIYADDMGYGDLKRQNPNSKIPTPHLDQLASEGMLFSDAHSASTVCSPSRYSLLTGRYHWRGYLKRGIVGAWGDPVIEDGRLTIASMLKAAGYRTAIIGKWHLGMIYPFKDELGQNDPDKPAWRDRDTTRYTADAFDWSRKVKKGPVANGFDYYFGDGTINFPPYVWMENDRFLGTPTAYLGHMDEPIAEGGWDLRPGPAMADWDIPKVPIRMTEEAVNWIAQQTADTPFFLYFALPSPHTPIVPTEEFQGISDAGGYGDYMAQTDSMVGQILEALQRHHFDQDTLVIFTSDNGPELYAYDRIQNYDHYSSGPWRGVKRDLWEGGHRVPFIVKYLGRIEPDSINHHLISQVDILATLANIVGYNLPEDAAEDSVNFSETLFADKSPSGRSELVYHSVAGQFALRKGDWILIEASTAEVTEEPDWVEPNSSGINEPYVLYNISEDPGQRVNLYREKPQKAIEMLSALNAIRQKGQRK